MKSRCNGKLTSLWPKWKSFSRVQLFVTPWTIYSPWNSLGQNTGVGSFSLLQGIFPTQGSNTVSLIAGGFCNQLSHKESPRILEWVAYPFSSGSSWIDLGSPALQADCLQLNYQGSLHLLNLKLNLKSLTKSIFLYWKLVGHFSNHTSLVKNVPSN